MSRSSSLSSQSASSAATSGKARSGPGSLEDRRGVAEALEVTEVVVERHLRDAAQHVLLQFGRDDRPIALDEPGRTLDHPTLGTFDVHLQEADRTCHDVVEAEGRHHDARMCQQILVVDQPAVGADVRGVVRPTGGGVCGDGDQLHVPVAMQAERRQQQPAVLRVRFERDDLPRGTDQRRGQHRVVAEVGTHVDDGHAGPAVPLEDRGQVGLVLAGPQTRCHGGVGCVTEQLDVTDAARHRVFLGELDGERRRRLLVLDHPEHAADRRHLAQFSGRRLVDFGTEPVGQCGVEQVHELLVGDAALGNAAAEAAHDSVPPGPQRAPDLAPPVVATVFHVRPTVPRDRYPPGRTGPAAVLPARAPRGLEMGGDCGCSTSAPGRIRTCVTRIRSPLPKSARPPGRADPRRRTKPDIARLTGVRIRPGVHRRGSSAVPSPAGRCATLVPLGGRSSVG